MRATIRQGHDMSAAADLFAWTYQRSCAKYGAVLQAMGVPDPVRVQLRPQLTEAICQVVQNRKTFTEVLADMGLPRAREELFEPLLRRELTRLQEHNCGRFRPPRCRGRFATRSKSCRAARSSARA